MAYLGVQEKIFRTFYTIIIKIRILIFYVYQLDEIVTIMNWLQKEFGTKWFPLANDVQKLGNGTEVAGLGPLAFPHLEDNSKHFLAISPTNPCFLIYFPFNCTEIAPGSI